MAYIQYALLASLTGVALLYYLRLDKLDKRVHVRRIVRIHRTLGLLTLVGIALVCPPVSLVVLPLIPAALVLAVAALYLYATRNDWKDGQVPEYATTSPGTLDHFLNSQ
jgi:hypothetical protein